MKQIGRKKHPCYQFIAVFMVTQYNFPIAIIHYETVLQFVYLSKNKVKVHLWRFNSTDCMCL